MFDAIFCAARDSAFVLPWRHIRTHITALFDESSPPSLNRVITLTASFAGWDWLEIQNAVARWAAAVLEVQYSEEVGYSVFVTLSQVSRRDSLRTHIPVDIWALLRKRPPLPATCWERSGASEGPAFHYVRGLGDIEILKSYLLLTFSEWDRLHNDGLAEMEVSMRKDFGGIGMWCHRDDLIQHLGHVRGQLDRGLDYLEQHDPRIWEGDMQRRKEQYDHLKGLLLEVDKTAMNTLTRTSPSLIFSN